MNGLKYTQLLIKLRMINYCKLLFFIFISSNLFAQDVILSSQEKAGGFLNISAKTSILVAPSPSLSFEEIQKAPFLPSQKKNLLFPFSNNTYWAKTTIKNVSDQKEWVIEWNNAITENVDFYIPDNQGVYEVTKLGSFSSLNKNKFSENVPHITFAIAQNQQKTIYLKIRSQRGHYSKLQLYTPAAYHQDELSSFMTNGVFSGLIIIRLFYVLLLAIFAVKELAFRRYSMLLIFRSLAYWGFLSMLGSLFTQNAVVAAIINFEAYHLLPIGQVLVVRALLPFDKFHPSIRVIFNLIVIVTLILGVFIFFNYNWYWLLASTYIVICTQLLVFGLYIFAVFRKYSINWYYSIPFLLGIGSYIFLQMRLVGWLDFVWIIPFANLCFISEIFVFGLFLGRIILNYERARASSEKQLLFTQAQTNKLQELDTLKTHFFTNISHEFRTPLTLLLSPLEDFRKKYPQESMIPIMQRNVNRLQNLIDQLLDLVKLEAGKLDVDIIKADLPVFVNQFFASFESLAQSRNIIFSYNQNLRNKEAYFDADKLEKIISNLLSNAFKFVPDQGRVVATVTYSEAQMMVEIKDFGIGIEKSQLPFIFDRFYQINNNNQRHYEGTGIGLALVKELVEVLKGSISVDSELGKGAKFVVRIPIDKKTWNDKIGISEKLDKQPKIKEIAVVNSPNLASKLSSTSEQPILLLVEDNPDLLSYIQRIFENDYQIVLALDGEEGLAKATDLIPDLVITDLMMPRLDGFGLCQRLKSDERTSHIPVVMLTAKATIADRLIGLEKGADDYLAKPFNKEELTLRVSNLVHQRALMRSKYSAQTVAIIPTVENPQEPTLDELFIQKAKAVIDRHLDKSGFDVEEFADEMNLSAVQLRRKIKAITDQTATEFVRNYRLELAAEMLKRGEGTVSEIAYRVGFDSMPYFSKVFQEKYGKTASEWR